MWELTKSFRFEAAHALSGTTYGAESEAIHGHSFRAEVTVRGTPTRGFPRTMVCNAKVVASPNDVRLRRPSRRNRTRTPQVQSEGDQFAANRGDVQPPHTQGQDQSATLPLLAST